MKDIEIIFKHLTPIQVRFNDTDMMGHVTNMIHLSYCDVARMHYFQDVFGENVEHKNESLVIANVSLDFSKPIFIFENIVVKTSIHTIGKKSIQMIQHIINSETNELKTVVKTIISGYNYIDEHTIEIPQRWIKCIENFENHVHYKYQKHSEN